MPQVSSNNAIPDAPQASARSGQPSAVTTAAMVRRPYPTASTTTKVSPAPAGPRSISPTPRPATHVPATVWTFGNEIALDATWPEPVVDRVVAGFVRPGGVVALVAWPRRTARSHDSAPAIRDGDSGRVEDLIEAVLAAGYPVRRLAVPDTAPLSEASSPVHSRSLAGGPRGEDIGPGQDLPSSVDLIITAVEPGEVDEASADRLTLLAARALRAGGILAVLTHSDWGGGVLTDPTGVLVAAGQNADLLYLQHVVALHQPAHRVERGDGTTWQADRPHGRNHSDVLVLVQPHDHALDLANAAAA